MKRRLWQQWNLDGGGHSGDGRGDDEAPYVVRKKECENYVMVKQWGREIGDGPIMRNTSADG